MRVAQCGREHRGQPQPRVRVLVRARVRVRVGDRVGVRVRARARVRVALVHHGVQVVVHDHIELRRPAGREQT